MNTIFGYIKYAYEKTVLLLGTRKRAPIKNYDNLLNFIDQQTSYQVQRSFDDYCRARVSVNWQKLYKEEDFLDSYHTAIWSAYPLVMGDMLEMIGLCMHRDMHMKEQDINAILKKSIEDICKRYPVPRGFQDDFWQQAQSTLMGRFDKIDVTSNKAINRISIKHFRSVFDKIPIAEELRRIDYKLVLTNQRFLLCNAYETFKNLFESEEFISNL